MKKILAVSGGIDSMVMLDFLCSEFPDDYLVATIDHGTRPSSATDAAFVSRTAKDRYHLPCEIIPLHLGPDISESAARAARYAALFSLAGPDGQIFTAHHLDDLCESTAINLLRGTGWRGLAVLDRRPGPNSAPAPTSTSAPASPLGEPSLIRPFLSPDFCGSIPIDKSWVYHYAASHDIVFREDPTNASDDYLRNRLRPAVRALAPASKAKLYKLWQSQLSLKTQITLLTEEILGNQPRGLDRNFIKFVIATVPAAADELLRTWLLHHGITTTHLQRADLMHAIETYQNGKFFNLPGDILLEINKTLVFENINRFKN